MKKLTLCSLILSLLMLLACNRSDGVGVGEKQPKLAGYSNEVILNWNVMAFEAMGGVTYQHSLLASRINAMVHLAMHDALNGITGSYQTYALKRRDTDADPIVAAATAAHEVLVVSFPDKKAKLDSALTRSLAGIQTGSRFDRGVTLGKEAGTAILNLRKDDGALLDPIAPVTPSSRPGEYQAVAPMPFLFAPFWKQMKPFGLSKPDQFRVGPQPALNSREYTDAFNEVKQLGDLKSKTRSTDQTNYGKFWYEFSEIGWNRVARVVAADRKLDLLSTARLFALVNIAMADSYTAGWDSKFHYNFWRPKTAIQAAETDGNPATAADPQWEPLMPTPPVQDYPSTHSTLGNAAAVVMAQLLGDNVSFTMTSNTADPSNPKRSFTSFSQAAKENADSRVMVGIHFRFSCNAGLDLGAKVGQWTVSNYLKPTGALK
ncbi:vanadium-dependent haloperoxidase [Larkinella soli]|uniref:vanadium-dependent haloperoxidase n=1 Tax=Larkinella soli TaxID=1770527 RepID=UPI0019D2AE6C|nr:vanadium-dependent haloperoxidase [Larkinella soli]